MKTLITLFVIAGTLLSFQPAKAQSDKSLRTIGITTKTIKVNGVCDMCKKRIEKAALSVKGVTTAVWNQDTKQLALQYSAFKPEAIAEVEKKVSAVGHDAGKLKAVDAAYNALPDCCRYRNS